TSLNASLGATWRPRDNISLTADAYHISIDDRIVITSQFIAANDTIVQRILAPFPGVARAQFFANAVDTRTRGVDVVVAYARALGQGTRSEEHTSELQSLAYLVCRLLLEKKKTTKTAR